MDEVDLNNQVYHAVKVANLIESWRGKGIKLDIDDILDVEDIIKEYLKTHPLADSKEVGIYIIGFKTGYAEGMKEVIEHFEKMLGDD